MAMVEANSHRLSYPQAEAEADTEREGGVGGGFGGHGTVPLSLRVYERERVWVKYEKW